MKIKFKHRHKSTRVKKLHHLYKDSAVAVLWNFKITVMGLFKGKGKKRKAEEQEKDYVEEEPALPEEEKAGPSQEAKEESDSDSDDSNDDEK